MAKDLAAFLNTLIYPSNDPVHVYSSIMGKNGQVSGSVPVGYTSKKLAPQPGDTVLSVYGAIPNPDFVNAVALDKVVCVYVRTTQTEPPIVEGIYLRFREYSDVMFGDIPPDTK